MESEETKEVDHHKQNEFCKNRPAYRQGRKLTAVKVYTVASESQHLFIYNVPRIKLRKELKALCLRYGQIRNIHVVTGYKTDEFTECYHVQFERIQSARIAKRLIDNRSFYGSILHVCYVPEYETAEETVNKLVQRKADVLRRLQALKNPTADSHLSSNRKRKLSIDEVEDPLDPNFKLQCSELSGDSNAVERILPAPSYGPNLESYIETHSDSIQRAPNAPKKRIVFKNK